MKATTSLVTFMARAGLVPFILCDEAIDARSPLDCLARIGAANLTEHCVSMRRAALLQRRKKDFQGLFHCAIQKSLKAGQHFVIVFEDDDAGAALGPEDWQENWTNRDTSVEVACNAVPKDWKLGAFFQPTSLPADIFLPSMFNGRGRAELFLEGHNKSANGHESLGHGIDSVLASPLPNSGAGLTDHAFELPADADALGVPIVHQIRPAVVATGRFPRGLTEAQLRSRLRERFGHHVPLHMTEVILLSGGQ